jgi:hypothetical protein
VLDTLVERPVSQEHKLELLLNHNVSNFLIVSFANYQLKKVFILVLMLLHHIHKSCLVLVLLLIVLRGMQLCYFVIALSVFFGVLKLTRFAVNHEIC